MTTNIKDIPQELVTDIEKLSNLGFGIAKLDGYVIFVEGACPGDRVKIKITKKNKNFANAKIEEIITPSPHRVQPFCPMHKVCGSCQLQFVDYNYQLELKKQIVEDSIRNICGAEINIKDVIPSPDIKAYRHKIQYPVSETKDSKRIIAGYFKPSSHELVNIKYCPIQPDICDKIIDFIREEAPKCRVSGYYEKKHSGDLRHVLIRSSKYNGQNLVILVVNSKTVTKESKELAKRIFDNFEEVSGVGVNLNPAKTNLILGKDTRIIQGEEFIEEKLCDKIFKIGCNTFFQVNPASAENIFNYVKNYISKNFSNPSILDAYAGIAAYGICLSDTASQVTSVEEVKESIDLADNIIKENNIKNIELVNQSMEDFADSKNHSLFDITVLDPPRKGCSEKTLDYILKLTAKKIIYVSCNPATLARDLKYLISKGCKVDSIQPFDMFPHTYHIENAAIISLG